MTRFARLHALGKRLGLTHADLSEAARANYGVPGLPGLSERQLGDLEAALAAKAPPSPSGGRPGRGKGWRPESVIVDGVPCPLATRAQIGKLLWLKDAHRMTRPMLYEAIRRQVPRTRGARNPIDALTRLEARECIQALQSALARRSYRG